MKKEILLILILIFFPITNADIISINSGGGSETSINPDTYIEGFFSCIPTTCTSLGYNCDSWSDGCGGTLNCGTCSSGQTCSSGVCTTVTAPPAGGGGGGFIKKVKELKLIPERINLNANSGSTIPAKVDMLNIGNRILEIAATLTESLENIISLSQTSFTINPNEIATLNIQITAPQEAGIYTGKIRLSVSGKIQELPITINVRSGISLFDISLDITEENRIINQGESLKGQITLTQAGIQEPQDVSLHYIIKDYEDNVYIEESETIMVYKQKSYEHEFNTKNLQPGDYLIGAEVIYEGGVATASYPFQIRDQKITGIKLIYIALILILILAIISIILIIKHYKQLRTHYKKRK